MIESCRKVGFTSLTFDTSKGGNQLKLLGARFRTEESSRHRELLNKEHTMLEMFTTLSQAVHTPREN